MKKKWYEFWKKSPRTAEDILKNLKPVYANNFKEVVQSHIGIGAIRMIKNEMGIPVDIKFYTPRVIYGWLDPNSSMEENHSWMLYEIDSNFFEVDLMEKMSDNPEESRKPRIRHQDPIKLEELQERIKCGDYSHMINEDTDKTVNDELEQIFINN